MFRPRGSMVRVWTLSIAGLVVIVGATWWVASLNSRGREGQQHLLAARTALSGGVTGLLGDSTPTSGSDVAPATQLANACAEAAAADALLSDVGGQVQTVMPLVDALGSVPGVGTRTRSQAAALETGTQLAAAGTALCAGMQPLTELLVAEQSTATGSGSARAAIQALLTARPKLVEASDRLEKMLKSLSTISDADLDDSTRLAMGSLRSKLPELVRTLRDSTSLLDLLGSRGARRFLLVSQNPDELRATGGYIGSAGVVEVADGNVRLLEYGSSRAYDTPPDRRAITPQPFAVYLGDYWELAGANWWASFPDVARQLAYFYTLARPDQHIDGVVALDQVGLQRLLEVLGPVEVVEYSESVGAADLQAALDRHVHAGDTSDEAGRKQFTAALSTAVLNRVLNAPRPLVPGLVRAVRTALDQQHLLVSVSDSDAAAVLARRHWDGSLLPTAQDGLLVVDTEVVGSKQSQSIRRDTDYRVDLVSPAGPRASATITYTNLSSPQPNVFYLPDYRTFVRLYGPSGATLSSSEGFAGPVMASQECGRAVFGSEVLIPQGATVQVRLTYELPTTVVGVDGYDLVAQHQPGVPPGRLSVSVNRSNAQAATVSVESTPGRNYHWRLSSEGAGEFGEAPLPEPAAGGCGIPLVSAAPIAAPAWVEIPGAHVSASVIDLGVGADGAMESPPTPDVVGWYRMSARAGQPGNSVFSGHVDWGHNTAVFWGLRNLSPNDAILLRGSDGVQHRYVVEWNRVFARTDPTTSGIVGASKASILTLITCDGVYDQSIRDYLDRRVVRAVLSE
jgi:hypothetical protein